eukprot:6207175-Pleurochrysis_carterae.AAC.2
MEPCELSSAAYNSPCLRLMIMAGGLQASVPKRLPTQALQISSGDMQRARRRSQAPLTLLNSASSQLLKTELTINLFME